MSVIHIGQDVFEITRNLVEVTSMHRPDVGRVVADAAGHLHSWRGPDGVIASRYDPSVHYTMPSLVWIKDGEAYYGDDDWPHDVGHHECLACGEHIEPPYTADTEPRYIAGLMRCSINGVSVSAEEFRRRLNEHLR